MPTKTPTPAERLHFAKQAEQYILRHLNQNISIADLSTTIGTSERTLHLGFKERFGIAPKTFMQIIRLNKAQQLLRGKKISITEVAFACGFNHHGRFSGQYQRLFNETPSSTKNTFKC